MTPGILYISYDGMLEPLGQSQVLAYLEKLSSGRRIHLISFEKRSDWRNQANREQLRKRIGQVGIVWHPLTYHRTPSAPATAYDIAQGTALALALAIRHRLSIVHARSYVPALMALAVKRATGAQFLFDMRGLWADERVDGGLWPADGRLYRTTKRLERRFLATADHIVTLTDASVPELRKIGAGAVPITVIPTCADLEHFSIQGPSPHSPFTIGYVGSVGTWYLLDEMMRSFRFVAEQLPDARLLIVSRSEHQLIRERARACGIAPASVELVAAEHRQMPALIGRMSAAMAIIKPSFSKIASAPTKLAEYLGCGVPCLGNVKVGDMEAILDGQQVGVALSDFSDSTMRKGVARLIALTRDPSTQKRCRDVATSRFSLEGGAASYDAVYTAFACINDLKISNRTRPILNSSI